MTSQQRPDEAGRFRSPGGRDVALPLSFGPITVGQVLVAGDVVLSWYSVVEPTGAAPARVQFFDGADATGQLLATVTLGPGESASDSPGMRGLFCTRGLAVVVNTGTVQGTVGVVDA